MARFDIEDNNEKEEEMEDEARAKPKRKEKSVSEWLDWVAEHKIFTVILLFLIILGFGRIAKHFGKIERHLA